jgi:hypothetical protein
MSAQYCAVGGFRDSAAANTLSLRQFDTRTKFESGANNVEEFGNDFSLLFFSTPAKLFIDMKIVNL